MLPAIGNAAAWGAHVTELAKAATRPAGELDARFIGDIFGSLVFPDRVVDETSVCPFRARSISPRSAVITLEVEARRGEPVALRFDGIGIRHGAVERVFKGGFVVAFDEEPSIASELLERIDWLKLKSRGKAEERRAHRRVLPRDPAARVIFNRDHTEPCQIKDMSQSGAAIQCAVIPPVGQLVAVGAVPGRVVRHFEGGFAIRFVELQNLSVLEGLMTLRTGAEKQMAARRIDQTARRLGTDE